jgi:hypothetical protein
MTTLDPPTLPRAITVSRATVRALRRQTVSRTQRQRDLADASLGKAIARPYAIEICARMSAWCDRTPDENEAVRALMRCHDITTPMIREKQRALDIPVSDLPPLRRERRR